MKHDAAYAFESGGVWLISPDDSVGNAYVIDLPEEIDPAEFDRLLPEGWTRSWLDADQAYHFLTTGLDDQDTCEVCRA